MLDISESLAALAEPSIAPRYPVIAVARTNGSAAAPSNSDENPENSPTDQFPAHAGLDWITITFPIARSLTEHWKRGPGRPWWFSLDVDVSLPHGAPVRVKLRHAGANGQQAVVLCNPSTGSGLARLDGLPGLGRAMYDLGSEFVVPRGGFSAVRFSRIDVAVDFATDLAVRPLLDAIRACPSRRAKTVWQYFDPKTNAAQSLYISPSAKSAERQQQGLVRIYDRRAADPSRDRGIRFEVEARKGWLKQYGLRNASTVDPQALVRLANAKFRWAGADVPILHRETWIDRLEGYRDEEGRPLSELKKDRIVGAVERRRTGHSTLTRHEAALLRDLGSPGIDLDEECRLDFATGTVVPA